jgi:hypothetical protein
MHHLNHLITSWILLVDDGELTTGVVFKGDIRRVVHIAVTVRGIHRARFIEASARDVHFHIAG